MMSTLQPPAGLTEWLASAMFVVVVIYYVQRLVAGFRGKPTAADVQHDAAGKYQPKGDYATRADLDRLEVRIEAMTGVIQRKRDELREHIDQSVDKVGDRVESMRSEMGEMERRINALTEQRAVASHQRHNELLAAVSELRGAFTESRK
jgi:seryl-tRNA synthetase